MTLGFICSFIVMVFGIGIYALIGLISLISGIANAPGVERARIAEEEFKKRIKINVGKQLDYQVEMRGWLSQEKFKNIYDEFGTELRYIFGDDYEQEFKRFFKRNRWGRDYYKLADHLAMIRLAKIGQGDWLINVDFDKDSFDRSLKYCKVIEDCWRKAGIDVHLELLKSKKEPVRYYMIPSEIRHHGILGPGPDFRW